MKSLYSETARLMANPRAWESVEAVSGRKTWLFRALTAEKLLRYRDAMFA